VRDEGLEGVKVVVRGRGIAGRESEWIKSRIAVRKMQIVCYQVFSYCV
jgi:hypothetical protein